MAIQNKEVSAALSRSGIFTSMDFARAIAIFALGLCSLMAGQAPPKLASPSTSGKSVSPPALPVITYNACPFEGCKFWKWIVNKDIVTLSSTWKDGRTTVTTLRKDQVVTGITGVHITYEPDRIEMTQPIPEQQLQPGDVLLRYMYRGEGFADVWFKGQWHREYDCSFVTEMNSSGCARECAAKVVSEGRRDWWVQVKTSKNISGWVKADDQFNCMDSLSVDEKCDVLNDPSRKSR
jgi:hypothetical protein